MASPARCGVSAHSAHRLTAAFHPAEVYHSRLCRALGGRPKEIRNRFQLKSLAWSSREVAKLCVAPSSAFSWAFATALPAYPNRHPLSRLPRLGDPSLPISDPVRSSLSSSHITNRLAPSRFILFYPVLFYSSFFFYLSVCPVSSSLPPLLPFFNRSVRLRRSAAGGLQICLAFSF